MSETQPTVLIVDDEAAIVDGYAARLSEQYEVRTAYDGIEALDLLDGSVDVVLLDRRMPGLSGDEILAQIRERDLDCRVAMLTGVEPALDIVDMGFDDYLCKPVGEAELFETVERLLTRSRYDAKLQKFFSIASKIGVLEAEYDHEELMADPEYEAMMERLERLERELEATLDDLSQHDAYAVALGRDASGGASPS